MSGNRRITVQQRADGNGDADPGKLPLSFSGHRMLARYALCHAKAAKQTLLAHSYLILCWNLMARSNIASNYFRATFPYLVASVIYLPLDWLVEHLPENHPFFTSLIYTRNYKSIWGPLIVTGFFENEESGMRSSGLPKYINVHCENEKVREEIRAIPDAVVSKISSVNNVQIYNTELIDSQFGHRFDNIENILATNFTRSPTSGGFEHANSQFHAFPEGFKVPCEPAMKIWLFGDEN
jgi:hypothetical protein